MIADKDCSGQLDYLEFMTYTFTLIRGTFEDKINFVF